MSQKGGIGEREVAGIISPWWCEYEPGTEFVRTPKSGGWGAAAAFKATGDLMTTSVTFPFDVEVKRREKEWSLPMILRGTGNAFKWWIQCQEGAIKSNREPMLWMRKNRQPWWLMMRRLFVEGKWWAKNLSTVEIPKSVLLAVQYGKHEPILVEADSFIRNVHPSSLVES
jgi:hypothetical protein